MGRRSHRKDEVHCWGWALKTPFVDQHFLSLTSLIGGGKDICPEAEEKQGGRVIRTGSALNGQSLKNSPEVTNASAGNRLRIRTKVEDLDRNIALITIVHQSP